MSNATSSTEGPEPEAASHPPRPGMPPTELVQMTRITLQNFRLARTSKVKMKIKYFDPDTDEDRVFVRFLPLSAVEFAKAKEGRGKDESRKRNDFHIKIPDSLLIAEDFQVQIRTVKRYTRVSTPIKIYILLCIILFQNSLSQIRIPAEF